MSSKRSGPYQNNAPQVVAEVRRYEVLQLKMAGATYQAIAEKTGAPLVQIHRDLKRILGDMAKDAKNVDAADRLRALMMERYNRLLLAVWPRAIGGDLDAVGTALSILGHVRAINGLDPKTPINVDARSIHLSAPEATVEALMRKALEEGYVVRAEEAVQSGNGRVLTDGNLQEAIDRDKGNS